MEECLEKRIYAYRKSYHYYRRISISLSVSKCVLSASGLAGLILLPLAALSCSAIIIEGIEKALSVAERKQEYRLGYKFYKELLNLWKAGKISESELYLKEKEFINNLNYFPRETYLQEMKINGYK